MSLEDLLKAQRGALVLVELDAVAVLLVGDATRGGRLHDLVAIRYYQGLTIRPDGQLSLCEPAGVASRATRVLRNAATNLPER